MFIRISKQICVLAALWSLAACLSSGESDLFEEVQTARQHALAIETRTSPIEAIGSYQAATDLMTRFLDQYPDGAHADQVRSMREEMSKELRALRYELEEFQKTQKAELNLTQPRLPSECEAMTNLWQSYIDRLPSSRFAGHARQQQTRWKDREQEEIKRGFQIIIDEADVRPVKGPSHQLMAGRPWDPEIAGQSSPPDPYALLVMRDQTVSHSPVTQDSFHAVWNQASAVLRVSDSQEVTILVRDRDVVNDDTIGKWTGTIHDLIESGPYGTLRAGDFDHLKVRVVRPR